MRALLFFAALAAGIGVVQASAYAELIKDKTHFKKYGEPDWFRWAPSRYQTDFRYNIPYYIPARLKNVSQAKAMIFLHGGGKSTLTRQGCEDAINLVFPKLKKLADDIGFVLVMPSSEGLNWTSHTRGLLRDLAGVMRTELDLDPNLIGVAGHSMGGMGITRFYQYGADEFAFYMPMSSGIDTSKEWQWNDEFLYKVFNVPYIQFQGTRDMFHMFVTRNKKHASRISELEKKYDFKSKFRVILFNGQHELDWNYTDLIKKYLSAQFEVPRDLYQAKLFGTILTQNKTGNEYNIPVNLDSESRYFWVEFTDSDLSKEEQTHFQTDITGQKVSIELKSIPQQSKNIRVYLSERMIDLEKEITVQINQKTVATRAPRYLPEKSISNIDPGALFNDYIDIPVSKL